MSNGSIYRSIQKGNFNYSLKINSGTNSSTITKQINISSLKDVNKAKLILSDVSKSNYITSYTTSISTNQITFKINLVGNNGNFALNATFSGSWRLEELW